MAKRIGELQSLSGGISRSKKFGPPNSFAFGRSIDFRNEPSEITVLPRTVKISTLTDLTMWPDIAGDNLYFHGNSGSIYKVDSSDTVVKEYTVSNSTGNGLAYLPEDKYLYIPTDTSISRRSNAHTTGSYVERFLESEGGEPTNTRSLSLLSASSQSATRADTASLSITGDITLEAYIKPTTTPTGTNKMTLISKWDESGSLRSYKFDLIPTTASFGDGSDSSLTVSVNTTDTPIDSACSGTAGAVSLSATNASFAAGQKILIHYSRGALAGLKEVNEIQSYIAGTITLVNPLENTYSSTGSDRSQVMVLKEYTNVTVNSGITWTAKAWDGTVGGILAFLASGTFTNNGTITATGKALQGAQAQTTAGGTGYQGEGPAVVNTLTLSTVTGPGGGGGGGSSTTRAAGGGGGGNSSVGSAGDTGGSGATAGAGGLTTGSADLTTAGFGGGGGSGGSSSVGSGHSTGTGGNGGGFIFISAATFTNTGSIVANGNAGGNPTRDGLGAGGGGAGGSILIKTQSATLGTGLITATAGAGGTGTGFGPIYGGAGAPGRIHIDYSTSYTGTTNPTIDYTEDSSLAAANGVGLRFYVSSTGANSESYSQDIVDPTGFFTRYSVAWDASASTAYFYKNGELIGTRTGALTAIHDNATEFGVGVSKDSGGTRSSFYNGLIDDVRVWNTLRSASDILTYNNRVLTGLETNLVAYYKFDSNVNDSQTSGLNNLTANNTPTYSTDIPFSGVTTRGDQDVFIDASSQTYTLSTAINEGATHRQTFTPTKEPLKSVAFNIDTVGTGNWTVVVHDSLNRELTSVTVANADVRTGIFEFVFAASSRPVLNADYHVHVYSSVGDGKVVTGTVSDLETAYFKSFFQILVDDDYHPAKQFLNFLVIGNERYVAKLEAGSVYDPHRLVLPSGYRVRCFAPWRDYIAIGTTRGDDITDTDQGKIFFWDGTSDTYVEPLDVSQGSINSMHGTQGKLTLSAGYQGQILEYTGGDEARPLFYIPQKARTDYVEIAPGAITMWKGLIHIGATLDTNSSTIHQGVYSFGRLDDGESRALGFDYPLSIGDQTSSLVKVGCLIPRGKKLYIGWQNGSAYGLDVVDVDADPFATSTIELLLTDLGSVPRLKMPLTFRVDFEPLESGESVSIKYKPDRATDWRPLKTQSTAGATDVRVPLAKRIKEVQYAIDITDAPTITSISLEQDDETEARKI